MSGKKCKRSIELLSDSKKKSIDTTDGSISFVEMPWNDNDDHVTANFEYLKEIRNSIDQIDIALFRKEMEAENNEKKETTGGRSIDPLFYPFEFFIPNTLSKFIGDLPLRYKIIDDSVLKICRDNEPVFIFEVSEYTNIYKTTAKHVIVVNQKSYRSKLNAENTSNYRKAIENSSNYLRATDYEDMRNIVFEFQLNNNVNMFYIESKDDLLRELKVVVKSLEPKIYTPKTKTFKNENGDLFFKYVISLIPGISKNVANTLFDRFKSISSLVQFLVSDTEDNLSSIKIPVDGEYIQFRDLGKKQSLLIRRYILAKP